MKKKKLKKKTLLSLGSAVLATGIIAIIPIVLISNKNQKIKENFVSNSSFELSPKEIEAINKIKKLSFKNPNITFENLKNLSNRRINNEIDLKEIDKKYEIVLEKLVFLEDIELSKVTLKFTKLNSNENESKSSIEKDFLIKKSPEYFFDNNEEFEIFFEKEFFYDSNNVNLNSLTELVKINQNNNKYKYSVSKILLKNNKLVAEIKKTSDNNEKEILYKKLKNVKYNSIQLLENYENIFNKIKFIEIKNNNFFQTNLDQANSSHINISGLEKGINYFTKKLIKISKNIYKISLVIHDSNRNNFMEKEISFFNNNIIDIFDNQKSIKTSLSKEQFLSDFWSFEENLNYLEKDFNNLKKVSIFNDSDENTLIVMKDSKSEISKLFKVEFSPIKSDNNESFQKYFSHINSAQLVKEYENLLSIEEIKDLIKKNQTKLKKIIKLNNLGNDEFIDFTIDEIYNSRENNTKILVSIFNKTNTSSKIQKEIVLYKITPINTYVQNKVNDFKKNIIFNSNELKKMSFEDLKEVWFRENRNEFFNKLLKIDFPMHKNIRVYFNNMIFKGNENKNVEFRINLAYDFEFDYFDLAKIDFEMKLVVENIASISEIYSKILNDYHQRIWINSQNLLNFSNYNFYKFTKEDLIDKFNFIKSELVLNNNLKFEILKFERDLNDNKYKIETDLILENIKKSMKFEITTLQVPRETISNFLLENGVRINLLFKRNFQIEGNDGYVIDSSNIPYEKSTISIPTYVNEIKVIGIEKFAFFNKRIKKVYLGANLEFIGKSAFEKNEIEELTIPEKITKIQERAFSKNKIWAISFTGKSIAIQENTFSFNVVEILKLKGIINFNNFNINNFQENKIQYGWFFVPLFKTSIRIIYHETNNDTHTKIINSIKKFSINQWIETKIY
ncbi:hypothetical protein [[Mycoplasma] mobile]|uniref:Expressed protein n=1 Tax=Mycoplasma mobile (strain ATCC 43663 / 163K / NCTC 11711) TaxID=267748 RepID=Q6KHD1_MYCM1|nr:hypothetical protein [[Mycoplasma] mobile]AAT27999.1 expressed protein [Mycoplasma mobile 163K]